MAAQTQQPPIPTINSAPRRRGLVHGLLITSSTRREQQQQAVMPGWPAQARALSRRPWPLSLWRRIMLKVSIDANAPRSPSRPSGPPLAAIPGDRGPGDQEQGTGRQLTERAGRRVFRLFGAPATRHPSAVPTLRSAVRAAEQIVVRDLTKPPRTAPPRPARQAAAPLPSDLQLYRTTCLKS